MRLRSTLALLAVAAATLAFTACGSDTTETVTDTEQVTPATTATTTPTTTSSTTPTTTSTTTAGADCNYNNGEIYSSVSGTCVQQRSGDNPCPAGEVPMADQATCVKEDDQSSDSTTG